MVQSLGSVVASEDWHPIDVSSGGKCCFLRSAYETRDSMDASKGLPFKVSRNLSKVGA